MTYSSNEQQLKPQLPLFGAAFVAGMTASTWKPGPRNVWGEGSYAVAGQAGWGILTNWLSEFSRDTAVYKAKAGRKFDTWVGKTLVQKTLYGRHAGRQEE
ncbi:MAG TPA: hypothetical protein VEI01_11185 [Terriglobales bacterium]|nr:hypothetical protein [Terriglobales bacterium]